MSETIGFIGLGIMGKPMALNLLKAGYTLIVLNRHQNVTDELVAAGASSAGFIALAEQLQIPVTITLMGKGGFPEDHPLYAGIAGIQTQTRYGNQIFLESDLVLAVGARFAERHTGDLEVYRGEAGEAR